MSSKKKGGKGISKQTVPEPELPPPNWPAFKPILPAEDFELETIVDSQIVVIRNFWTSTLCKNYVSFLKTLPLVTTPGQPKKGEALRVNDRFQVKDPAFANRLWVETGLRELVCGSDLGEQDNEGSTKQDRDLLWGGEPLGLNPNIRVYRYTQGQYFDCHYDESNRILLSPPSTPISTPARTTWTMLLYLTSSSTGCQGGETVFYPEEMSHKGAPAEKPVVIDLETGLLLFHKHGNDCMLHEGCEVTAGEKWVIRSDLCVRK